MRSWDEVFNFKNPFHQEGFLHRVEISCQLIRRLENQHWTMEWFATFICQPNFSNIIHSEVPVLPFPKCGLPFLCFQNYWWYEWFYSSYILGTQLYLEIKTLLKSLPTQLRICKPTYEHSREIIEFPKHNLRQICHRLPKFWKDILKGHTKKQRNRI